MFTVQPVRQQKCISVSESLGFLYSSNLKMEAAIFFSKSRYVATELFYAFRNNAVLKINAPKPKILKCISFEQMCSPLSPDMKAAVLRSTDWTNLYADQWIDVTKRTHVHTYIHTYIYTLTTHTRARSYKYTIYYML